MKTLILMTLATLLSVGYVAEESESSKNVELETLVGSIVTQDDITLIVDSENPSADITEIEIEYVEIFDGCYQQDCSVDISDLDPGIYDVVVTTDLPSTFSGTFIKVN